MQVACILNLNKLTQNAMQFSRRNSKDRRNSFGFEISLWDWDIYHWNSTFWWAAEEKSLYCLHVYRNDGNCDRSLKPTRFSSFSLRVRMWRGLVLVSGLGFFWVWGFFGFGGGWGLFFSLNNVHMFRSILTLYYFAFLRKMEFVTTCYVSVFTLSWKAGKDGLCSAVEECVFQVTG